MKFYFHFEVQQPHFTLVVEALRTIPVSVLIEKFTETYKTRFNIDLANLVAKDEDGDLLKPTDEIGKRAGNGGDVFLEFGAVPSQPETPAAPAPPEESFSAKATRLQKEGNAAYELQAWPLALQRYSEAIELLTDYRGQERFNLAEILSTLLSNRCQVLLKLEQWPDACMDAARAVEANEANGKAAFRLGLSLIKIEEYVQALWALKPLLGHQNFAKEADKLIKQAEAALKAQTDSLMAAEEIEKGLAQVNILLENQRIRPAASILQEILQHRPWLLAALDLLGSLYYTAGRITSALTCFARAAYKEPTPERQSRLGECYFQLKLYSTALRFFRESGLATVHVKVMTGRCMYELGQLQAAYEIYRGILIQDENCVEALVEFGQVQMLNGIAEPLKIFLKCLVQEPPNKVVRQRLADAISLPGGVECVLAEFQSVGIQDAGLGFLATVIRTHGAVRASVRLYERAIEANPLDTYALVLSHTYQAFMEYESSYEVTLAALERHQEQLGDLDLKSTLAVLPRSLSSNYPSNFDLAELPTPKALRQWSDADLDRIGLLFTLVKVLFLVECLVPLRQLLPTALEVRTEDLHKTTIRNEHAYFACIYKLFATLKAPAPDLEPIYVVGDSHCLTLAWRTIRLEGKMFRLIPKLVTGLKIWHLRPESTFYPKTNWLSAIASIPPRSRVIFLVGEIDCREGVLKATERLYYDSVDEALAMLIEIYVAELQRVVTTKRFKPYLHPANPVLDETRPVVLKLNALLAANASRVPGATWIPIDGLLDEKGLKTEYVLDGTHLSPSYISLIEAAL